MDSVDQYALCDPTLAHKVSALWNSLRYIVRRVLAILGVLGLTYGLIAAEVELAKIEQITESVPR